MFSPSTNTTSNFRSRLAGMQDVLRAEGLDTTEEYNAISRLFGYEGAVNEETFSEVVVACAKLGRSDMVPRLLDFLSSREQGRIGILLAQDRYYAAVAHVLPNLGRPQVLALVSSCLTRQRDEAFDTLHPFLSPDMCSPDFVCRAAANKASRFGQYFVENGDVLLALKVIKNPAVCDQVVQWWAAAIADQRVPMPTLGRAKAHWLKKFPALSRVLRSVELEQSLPSTPSRPRSRF